MAEFSRWYRDGWREKKERERERQVEVGGERSKWKTKQGIVELTSAFSVTMSSSSLETIGECLPLWGFRYSYKSFITTRDRKIERQIEGGGEDSQE